MQPFDVVGDTRNQLAIAGTEAVDFVRPLVVGELNLTIRAVRHGHSGRLVFQVDHRDTGR